MCLTHQSLGDYAGAFLCPKIAKVYRPKLVVVEVVFFSGKFLQKSQIFGFLGFLKW